MTEALPSPALGDKRSAETAELLEDRNDTKAVRVDDNLAGLDQSVRDRLETFFDTGVLRPSELDAQAVKQLMTFTAKNALDILDQFERAGLQNVRNKSAYLGGVMTRFRTRDTIQLHPDLQYWLNQLHTSGKLKQGDLDGRCIDALEALPVADGVRALERFFSKDFAEVRNPSALFMSTLKQVTNSSSSQRYSSHHAQSAPPASAYVARGAPSPSYHLQSSKGHRESYPSHMPAPPAYSVPPAAVVPAHPSLAGKRNYAAEQYQVGVRTEEFHNLSIFSPYVHPGTAIKLQSLWDSGVRLVSLLDDRAWEVLADLGAPEAAAAIDEVAEGIKAGRLRNPNAFLMSVSKEYLDGMRSHGAADRSYERAYNGAYRQPAAPQRRHAPRAGAPNLEGLSLAVQDRISELLVMHSRYLRDTHFDEGVVEAFKRISEAEQLSALDDVDAADMAGIRNMPAYIMGICKRQKRLLQELM